MKNDRRNFLKHTALASAGTLFVPQFLQAMQWDTSLKKGYKRIVMIQLSGGNDGLNTVIPYRNDAYYQARPVLGIPKNEVLPIADELGFHPALAPLRPLYDEGMLTVLNGVGYPNPDRSHFRSMDIWHTASESNEYLSTGWIGRFLDAECETCQKPYHAIEVDDTLSLALKGSQVNGIAVTDPRKLYRSTRGGHLDALHDFAEQTHLHEKEHELGYLYKTLVEAQSSASYIWEQSRIFQSKADYPQNRFAQNLKMIAELMGSGIDTPIFYASLTGFDTHANQKMRQATLLETWATALATFALDLKKQDLLKDTLVVTFSEFGRRVQENASRGTDHGTANVVFVVGDKLKKAGFFNPLPSLTNLDNGDLKYQLDFRRLYATMLSKWLKADDAQILGQHFQPLNFV